MSRFEFSYDTAQNGLIRINFAEKLQAQLFCDTLYQWGMTNLNGQVPRWPLPLDDNTFAITVTEEEFKLINQYNEVDSTDLEKTFSVFNPFLIAAADEVRLSHMTTPYAGAIDPLLEKKDYDTFEMVTMYTPPSPTKNQSGALSYRTEIESNARNAQALLKDPSKQITQRYAMKVELTPEFFDPATGYNLFQVEVDNTDNFNAREDIKAWIDEHREDIAIDTRFIVVKNNEKFLLYGQNAQTGEYEFVTADEDFINELQLNMQKIYSANTLSKVLQKITTSEEGIKNIIKIGKCFLRHPRESQVDIKEAENAFHTTQNAIRALLKENESSNEFKIHHEKTMSKAYDNQDIFTETNEDIYFFENEEDLIAFKEKVSQKTDEQTKKIYHLTSNKEYALTLNESELKLVMERLPSEFVVRPNHGFAHSMRAATYVPYLVQHYKKFDPKIYGSYDEMDIRLLQLQMLFSVVGRETEIGFGSGIKLLKMAEDIRIEGRKQFDNLQTEMESFDISIISEEERVRKINEFEEKSQAIKDLELQYNKIAERANAETNEYLTYRKASAFAFYNYCTTTGFEYFYALAKGRETKILTFTMYSPELEKMTAACLALDLDPTILEEGDDITIELSLLDYHTLLLYKMSDPTFEFGDGLGNIISNAHSLDLVRCYSKYPYQPGSFSFGSDINEFIPSSAKESESCRQSAVQLVKVAIQCLEATGNRVTLGLDENNNIIDKITDPDFSKSIPCGNSTAICLQNLSMIDVSPLKDLAKSINSNYEQAQIKSETISELANKLPPIVSCSRNVTNRGKINLEFATIEDAKLFCDIMVQSSILNENYHSDNIMGNIIVVTKNDFDKMQGYANYKVVHIPELHNEEDNLVDSEGEIACLSLIQEGNALVKNIDPNNEESIDFNFGQLNDPIHKRLPARLFMGHPAKEMGLNRHILMDITAKELRDTVKDFSFEIDKDIKTFKNNSEESEEYFRNWRESNKNNEKKFLLFQFMDPATHNTQWVCYGRDATGRYRSVILQYNKVGEKIKLTEENIFNSDDVLERMVVLYGYYKKLARGLRDYRPPEKQIPMDEKGITLRQDKEDYLVNEKRGLPVVHYSDMGKPANTIFTKKTSTTLLRPDGKTKLFNPDIWQEFIPVGLIYDVNKVHRHGDRYIWETDAYTTDKFWLGNIAEKVLRDPKQHHTGRNLSLKELKQHLLDNAFTNQPTSEWNELLVGLTKTAVKGIFVQNDDFISRLSMIRMYLRAKTEFGIDVPLFIIDGQTSPRRYTEEDIRNDLQVLFKANEENNFSALISNNKDPVLQKNMIAAFLTEININNLKVEHNSELEGMINEVIQQINMIGGLNRERIYLQRNWNSNDPTIQEKCLARAEALELREIVDLIKSQKKENDSYHSDSEYTSSSEGEFDSEYESEGELSSGYEYEGYNSGDESELEDDMESGDEIKKTKLDKRIKPVRFNEEKPLNKHQEKIKENVFPKKNKPGT